MKQTLGKKWGFSVTHRTSYISKNPNLYPHQARVTLYTLLWDTLYIDHSLFGNNKNIMIKKNDDIESDFTFAIRERASYFKYATTVKEGNGKFKELQARNFKIW
jgi:hypothetical protein